MSSIHRILVGVSVFLILASQLVNLVLPERNSLSPIIWYFWIALCLFYAFVTFTEKRGASSLGFSICLLLFWALNSVSFLLSPRTLAYNDINVFTIEIYKSLTIALLSYFPFYYFSLHGYLTKKLLLRFSFLLFVLFCFSFFSVRSEIDAESFQGEGGTINEAYNFVLLLPLLLLLNKRKASFVYLVISLIFVLLGAKRGAILCAFSVLFIYLVYSIKWSTWGRKRKGWIIAFLLLICVIAVYFINNDAYLQQRIFETSTEEDISGQIRTMRYGLLWNTFRSAPFLEMVFGNGFAQTVMLGGGLAHQDWLELLVDNGIIGLFFYLLMLVYCIKDIIKMKSHFRLMYMYLCCMAIWIIKASFSMVYTSRKCFVLFMIIGIIQGIMQNGRMYNNIVVANNES